MVHIESNYSRGLTAQFVHPTRESFNDLNQDIAVTQDTVIKIRKDRFVIAQIPVRVLDGQWQAAATRAGAEPEVEHFCIRVNDTTYAVKPGKRLNVTKGDTVVVLDPTTNLGTEGLENLRLDLGGYRAPSAPDQLEDRGRIIHTHRDLDARHALARGSVRLFPLAARLRDRKIGQCYIAVEEPRLEYVVLRDEGTGSFIAHAGDRIQIPDNTVLTIADIRTNAIREAPLFVSMSGRTLRWSKGERTGIDGSKLKSKAIPLHITRKGQTLGSIWLQAGERFVLSSSDGFPSRSPVHARYAR
jgi:hypothetical protein